jgi:hypothetical protein
LNPGGEDLHVRTIGPRKKVHCTLAGFVLAVLVNAVRDEKLTLASSRKGQDIFFLSVYLASK